MTDSCIELNELGCPAAPPKGTGFVPHEFVFDRKETEHGVVSELAIVNEPAILSPNNILDTHI